MWAGIALLIVVGMVHLIEAPEYFEDATYLGPCSSPPSLGPSWQQSAFLSLVVEEFFVVLCAVTITDKSEEFSTTV